MTNIIARIMLRRRAYTVLNMKPDSNQEKLHNIYNIRSRHLKKIVKEKNLVHLRRLGGPKGVAVALQTGVENGISNDAEGISHRRDVFGSNRYHKPPAKGLFYFVLEAFKDPTIMILLACAIVLLGLGIEEDGITNGLYKGGSIFFAVFIVIAVSAISRFRQSRQLDKLSSVGNNIKVDIVREGRQQEISIFDIVVGDIVHLKVGDQIPADGLFLEGHSLQIDESGTGGGEQMEVDEIRNPFLLSGAKVVDGSAIMLVTSVGIDTAWGEMMSSASLDTNEQTPLQAQLNNLTSYTTKVGLAVAILVFVVLLVRYFTGNTEDENGNQEFSGNKTKFGDVINAVARIVAAAVTIVVVAIPEGLQLALTLTLAYSMKRMMADQAMVRKISACETIGSITTICTDKTGTFTLNKMEVTKFWLGQEAMQDKPVSSIAAGVLELLHQGIGLNTTDTVYRMNPKARFGFSTFPTEKVILSWADSKIGMNIEEVKRSCSILRVKAFEKKRSGVMMRKNNDNTIHVHWKGAADMVLTMCSNYWESNGSMKAINEDERIVFQQIIRGMAANGLSCIAFAHKQILEEQIEYSQDGQVRQALKEDGLTLLGIVGIKDPCRPQVRETVQACKDARVNIKIITADDVLSARAIATACGILAQDEDLNTGASVEGVEFQNYTQEERMEKVERIRVMARSSPFHKLLMVQCLKQKGHVVAVTGDDKNDVAALKAADIGLSMGIQGTKVAKESSDIIILDDNFASMVAVLRWGRCVYNNIQKYIQFQLTVNVAALVINFVAAVSAGKVPLTAVQLLWVNLIMDTLGALALATELPTKELMKNPPVGRREPLITNEMWRNILAQALYQIATLLILQFRGKAIFGVSEKVKDTLIFNTFVLCQVFNEFNARRLEKKNVFKGMHRNKLFLVIVGIISILQVATVEFLNKITDMERLNWGQWAACIGMAAMSWPIGWTVKFIQVSDKPDPVLSTQATSLQEETELSIV